MDLDKKHKNEVTHQAHGRTGTNPMGHIQINGIFSKKYTEYLRISKKSSTFAAVFKYALKSTRKIG